VVDGLGEEIECLNVMIRNNQFCFVVRTYFGMGTHPDQEFSVSISNSS
jgi:hypothetical protein